MVLFVYCCEDKWYIDAHNTLCSEDLAVTKTSGLLGRLGGRLLRAASGRSRREEKGRGVEARGWCKDSRTGENRDQVESENEETRRDQTDNTTKMRAVKIDNRRQTRTK